MVSIKLSERSNNIQNHRNKKLLHLALILIALALATCSFYYFVRLQSSISVAGTPEMPLIHHESMLKGGPSSSSSSSDDDDHDGVPINHECNVSLNTAFLQHLQTLDPIPQKVHILFPDKNYWREQPPLTFVNANTKSHETQP